MTVDRFWEIFNERLELIDRILASRGTPISRRPWEASFFFLEHYIVKVSGMEKYEVVTHPMFRDMIRHSRRWYVERFGESLVGGERDDAAAMVVLFHTPFEVRFPLTITRLMGRQGLTELYFPRAVLRFEDSLTFLTSPPNLKRLNKRERANTKRRISRVVGLARRLNIDAMTADVGREDGAALASGIRISLEKGVRDVCSGDGGRLSTAIWEFNFAAEKALKVFLWQKSKPVPKTHDVRSLIRQAVARGLAVPPDSWVSAFPSGEDAVRYRYGEAGQPAVDMVMDLYGVALRLSVHCAQAFKRSIAMTGQGAIFYLKSPWD